MLTRREVLAAAAMKGFLSNEGYLKAIAETAAKEISNGNSVEKDETKVIHGMIAFDSVYMAEALMKALDHKVHHDEWTAEIRDGDGSEFHKGISGAV